ncbi:MobC family plasmid mobilization relaxosome protein [Azospirillum argentinense]
MATPPSTKGMKIHRPAADAVARLRLMSDVKEKWEKAAKAAGTDLSGWLRRAADAALAGGIESHQAAEAERRALRLELARIGNNLNQIARAVNSKESPHAHALDGIRAELARLNAEVGIR